MIDAIYIPDVGYQPVDKWRMATLLHAQMHLGPRRPNAEALVVARRPGQAQVLLWTPAADSVGSPYLEQLRSAGTVKLAVDHRITVKLPMLVAEYAVADALRIKRMLLDANDASAKVLRNRLFPYFPAYAHQEGCPLEVCVHAPELRNDVFIELYVLGLTKA